MKRTVMVTLCILCLMTGLTAFAGEKSKVVIENRSDWVIEELYMSPTDEDEWGPDQLEEDILEPGDSFTLVKVPCDYWDLLIIDEDGDECVLEEVDLCGDKATWSITNDELLNCIADTDE
jgi:hypothetical protein